MDPIAKRQAPGCREEDPAMYGEASRSQEEYTVPQLRPEGGRLSDMDSTDRHPRKTRVLLACELRYYRGVIAYALSELRADVEVTSVEPTDLDSSVLRLAADVVICSGVTEVVRENVPVWVELYPRHEAYSVVSIGGKLEEYALIELSDLLSIVDQAKGLAP